MQYFKNFPLDDIYYFEENNKIHHIIADEMKNE